MTTRPELVRLPDWPQRLLAELARQRELPFGWGEADCCTLAADCVRAMTGVDLLPERGWTDRDQARAALAAHGGLAAGLLRLLPPCPVATARRGDLGLLRHGETVSPVVCDGVVFVGRAESGLVRVPRERLMRRAYRVG